GLQPRSSIGRRSNAEEMSKWWLPGPENQRTERAKGLESPLYPQFNGTLPVERNLRRETRWFESSPTHQWPSSPTGRGSGLKIRTVWVRIPGGPPPLTS